MLHWLNVHVEDIELLELTIVTQGEEVGPPVHIAGHLSNWRGGLTEVDHNCLLGLIYFAF